jgi:hypothetical protein
VGKAGIQVFCRLSFLRLSASATGTRKVEVEIVLTGAPPSGKRQKPSPLAELEENGPITVWLCIKNWAEARELVKVVVLTLFPELPFIANR